MEELSQILSNATAAVEGGYFHLNIDGGHPVYRERVYCYELYHQMRMRWPLGCQFSLNGEVDKSAHPILGKRGINSKPDFLVHTPGNMRGNYAIIEVKKAEIDDRDGVKKDLIILNQFVRTACYKRAVYLFFGYGADQRVVEKVQSIACTLPRPASIEVWLHQQAGRPAIHSTTL